MCEFSSLLVCTFNVTFCHLHLCTLSLTLVKAGEYRQKPLFALQDVKEKGEKYGNNCPLYCLKLVLFLVFLLLHFLCLGPFARAWNKLSNSIFVSTFLNDYDWPAFDRSLTGLCQTWSGVKWVDT